MLAWMRLRMSVIILCADLESSCVRVNEVRPCSRVAPMTARTMGSRNCVWRLVMTLSTRYLVEAGRTKPQTRLTAIKPRPTSSTPLRGLSSSQISGRAFQVSVADFLGLPDAVETVPAPAERGAARSEWPMRVGLPGSVGTVFGWMQQSPGTLYCVPRAIRYAGAPRPGTRTNRVVGERAIEAEGTF